MYIPKHTSCSLRYFLSKGFFFIYLDFDSEYLNFRGIDTIFIVHHYGKIVDWIIAIVDLINKLVEFYPVDYFQPLSPFSEQVVLIR